LQVLQLSEWRERKLADLVRTIVRHGSEHVLRVEVVGRVNSIEQTQHERLVSLGACAFASVASIFIGDPMTTLPVRIAQGMTDDSDLAVSGSSLTRINGLFSLRAVNAWPFMVFIVGNWQ